MKLTHTADDSLACFGVRFDSKGRILFCQLAQRNPEFVEVLLSLGFDGYTDDRIGEFHAFERKLVGFIADGIARAQVFEAYGCTDVSRLHEIDGILVVGLHLVKPCYAFFLACAGVDHVGTGIKMS